MPFARTPGIGARLASSLLAAVKAGGCRHLWSLSVTLDDFDTRFLNAPRKGGAPRRLTQPRQRSSTDKSEDCKEGAPASGQIRLAPPPCGSCAHPMNALALARAFHPRAANGGVGALLNEGGKDVAVGRGGPRGAGARRGAIRSLGLPYARLHIRSVEEIAAHAITSLTHLDLSYCYVGPAGARVLARALCADGEGGVDGGGGGGGRGGGSRSLRSLHLPHNAVGDPGARALGHALMTNRCLTLLSLASNCIGHAGGCALASALGTRGVVLARLDVGDNPLGEQSARMLVSAAATAGGVEQRGSGATMVQIVGLDRVAGATVATREAARRAVATVEQDKSETKSACTWGAAADEAVGGERGTAGTILTVSEEVFLQSEDAVGGDGGFVQVIVQT